MVKVKAEIWKDVLIHLAIVIVLFLIMVIALFKWVFPTITNHGESITVPSVIGMDHSDVEDYLSTKRLRVEVSVDSGYSADYPPLTVLKQFPKENSHVKENRKIYVTLNATKPPLVKFPDLKGKSLKSTMLHFKSLGLILGKKKYVAGRFNNTVISFSMDGEDVETGSLVNQGAVIDVLLENGIGRQSFSTPDVVGLDQESAEFAILGSGLEIGEVILEKSDSLQGRVIRQLPTPNSKVTIGQIVNIWIAEMDSLAQSGSILDEDINE